MSRDGAAGTIGTAAVATARPDGYTLAFTPNGPIIEMLGVPFRGDPQAIVALKISGAVA